MKILLLGANGRTGRQLLSRALDKGDTVTAVVRGEDRLADVSHERLKVHIGSATDHKALAPLVPGHDVVVSTLGPRRPTMSASAIYHESAAAIIEAMQGTEVRRLIVTSSALLFPKQALFARILRVFVSKMVAAATRMEDQIRASNLDWTIVRTGFLTDDNTSTYQTSEHAGGTVSRAGVANFLGTEMEQRGHVREIVGLSA
jgi:putative NADH-flavin reductase